MQPSARAGVLHAAAIAAGADVPAACTDAPTAGADVLSDGGHLPAGSLAAAAGGRRDHWRMRTAGAGTGTERPFSGLTKGPAPRESRFE